jgi:prepilin-type N-terminal cleavage/methylation domain-containing protein
VSTAAGRQLSVASWQLAVAAPVSGNRQLTTGNCRRGFTLVELLVAIFVLAMAVAGAVAVIMTAGRSAAGARDKLLAEELARTALADAAYTADEMRAANDGLLSFVYNTNANDLHLGPAGYQRIGPSAAAPSVGWLWRAHSFDPAVGAYSLDVWVFRNPTEPSVSWGGAPDSALKRQQTLLYLQSKVETRKP